MSSSDDGYAGEGLGQGQALAAIDESVFLYNTMRFRLYFNYETPENTRRMAA
jgi:hypothetical protein